MTAKDHKVEYLDKKTQVVLLDEQGKSIDSCDTLFPVSILGDHPVSHLPFLESSWDTVLSFGVNQPLEFSCVRLGINDEEKYYDTALTKKIENKKSFIVWVLTDFTDHYSSVVFLQQQRNESEIKGEFLELEQKNIILQKQLLELKNNELQRIQEFKEGFYANLSHEVRTPVNGIVGLTELLKSKPGREKELEYIDSLESTAQHLISIVNDVLDLSKIEAGKLNLKEETVHINKTIKTVFNSFQSICDEKSIKLILRHEGKIPYGVISDRTKLNQILYNLVGNAIKFTTEGSVTLMIRYLEKIASVTNVQLILRDTGIGIPADKLASIFDPFEQIDNDISVKGTGLGLNIVKELVKLMGGEIEVSSELNVGTTFFVNLFLKTAFETKEDTSSKPKKDNSIIGKNILVVDDDLTSLVVLKDYLASYGANVSTTNNTSNVIEVLSREMFDIVLLDYHMPGISVEELLSNIKKDILNMNRLVPTIVLTGDTDDQVAKKLINKGVSKVMYKPFEPEQLIQTIHTVSNNFLEYSIENMSLENDVDLRYLRKIMGGAENSINDLIETFCQTMPTNIEQILQHYQNNEKDSLAELAHKAKSGCAYLGIHKVQRILHNLESDISNNRELKHYASILPEVQKGITNIIDGMKSKLKLNQ